MRDIQTINRDFQEIVSELTALEKKGDALAADKEANANYPTAKHVELDEQVKQAAARMQALGAELEKARANWRP